MAGCKILVVDDSEDAALGLAALLRLEGQDACVAFSGEQALEMAQSLSLDAAMVDITMPGMSGIDLARALREKFGDAFVLVAVTGWNASDPRLSGRFADFDHVLVKPVDAAMLHRLLPSP